MLPWLAYRVGPFCLGRSGRLSLRVCHFSLPWSWFAEDRVILGNVSWQLGPSLFILRYFFILSVSLGLGMKWARVAKSFGPTNNIWWIKSILKISFLGSYLFALKWWPFICFFLMNLELHVKQFKISFHFFNGFGLSSVLFLTIHLLLF